MISFKSNGKLLLTGEYLVLDGAVALALPTKMGQIMTVEPIEDEVILWKSTRHDGSVWFERKISFDQIRSKDSIDQSDDVFHLLSALREIHILNPLHFDQNGFQIHAHLEFPNDWGLGSSSTLINNLAKWAGVDAFNLNDLVFGGSGYDIACANSEKPLLFQRLNGLPLITQVAFRPKFHDNLWFVHLNKKQNSREAIKLYKNNPPIDAQVISEINDISELLCNCDSLDHFSALLEQHEMILSSVLKRPTISELLFPDFKGTIKSLGAWGGDFILAVGTKDKIKTFFEPQGFKTIIACNDLIKV